MKIWLIKTKMCDGYEVTTDVCESEEIAKLALQKMKELFKNRESRVEQLI